MNIKIPLEFYELLRNKITLSDVIRQKVNLIKKSGEYSGLCPFHVEKSPSFTVSDAKRFYHCFGCGAHGDVVKFVSSISGLSYKDSAIKLAADYAIELPKLSKEQERLYEESDEILNILGLASEFFSSELTKNTLYYLNKRNITAKLIDEFNIGFAPSGGKLQKFFDAKSIPILNLVKAGLMGKREDGRIYEIFHDRIIFPIRNIYNKIIGFGGRVIGEGVPKYLNSPETIVFKKSETLYGENKANTAIYKKNYSILVEGYIDVIALHKAGFNEAVASLGTAVTENHIQKLWRAGDEIILCLDGDSAGVRASSRVINMILPLINHEKKVSFIKLPRGKDPDDLVAESGSDAFQKLIDRRIGLSEMIWDIEYIGKSYNTPESKASLENALDNYCRQITDTSLKLNYKRFFKDQIWQKLIKRQQKSKSIDDSNLGIVDSELAEGYNYQDIERSEHALCSIVVNFPEIIRNEDVKNFLLTMNFRKRELSDFRDWFIEKLNENTDSSSSITKENIKESVKNTRFYDTFLLLINSDNLYLNAFFNKTIDCNLLWEMWHKQYYLVSLKQECVTIMQSNFDDAFEKVTLYREEILKISKELAELKESFTNN